jgi:copper chaperone CopZ
MTCASCVARVESALARVPGVERGSVNLATEQRHRRGPAAPTRPPWSAAVVRAGYDVPQRSVRLAIDGMTCASCVTRVERALAQVPGVKSAPASTWPPRRPMVQRWPAPPTMPPCSLAVRPRRLFRPRALADGMQVRRTHRSDHEGWLGRAGGTAFGTSGAADARRPAGRALDAAALWQWLLATPVQFCGSARASTAPAGRRCARAPATWTCWWPWAPARPMG